MAGVKYVLFRVVLAVVLGWAATQWLPSSVIRGLGGMWAHVYARFDPRIIPSYWHGDIDQDGVFDGEVGQVIVHIPARLFGAKRTNSHGRFFTLWDTGLPILVASFPLLVTRRHILPMIGAFLGAVVLAFGANLARLWLLYLSLFTDLPHFDVGWHLYWITFGAELVLCLAFCVYSARRRHGGNPILS